MAQEFTDAIALLKADHRKVEDLFEQFGKVSNAKKQRIAHELCNELKIHTSIEEEIFYTTFRGKIEDDTLDEAYVEHDSAKVLGLMTSPLHHPVPTSMMPKSRFCPKRSSTMCTRKKCHRTACSRSAGRPTSIWLHLGIR
jgi:hypothetical protein